MTPGEIGIHSILSANHADHARYRRLLSHTFSSLALRQQEHLLQSYIALLIHRLRSCASSPETATVDTVHWLYFTTFDIIGDPSLGSSFHCLDKSRYHSWLSVLFIQSKQACFTSVIGAWSQADISSSSTESFTCGEHVKRVWRGFHVAHIIIGSRYENLRTSSQLLLIQVSLGEGIQLI